MIHRVRLFADRNPRLFIAMLIAFCLFVTMLTGFAFASDLKLAWDPSDDAAGYKVQLSTDLGGTWSEPRDAGNSLTFTWIGAPDSGLILFRASAYNFSGEAVNYKKGAWYCGDWGAPVPASALGLK